MKGTTKYASGKLHKRKRTKPNLTSPSLPTRVTKKKKGSSVKSNDFSTLSVDDFMNFSLEVDSDSSDLNENSSSINQTVNGNFSSFVDDEEEEDDPLPDSSVYNEDEKGQEDEVLDSSSESIDDPSSADNTFMDAENEEDDNAAGEVLDEDSADEECSDEEEGFEDQGKKDYADLDDDHMDDEEEDLSAARHKKSLQKLQTTDPEFYKFLEDNDKKLLQFDVSDSDSDEEEKYHKPDEDLEVASEDSDYEADTDVKAEDGVITMKMIREWQDKIQTDKSLATISDVISGFHAAMIRVTSVEEQSKFKVDGSAVFNGIVQLCVLELQPALKRFLHMPSGSKGKHIQPQKCKKWKKVKPQLKSYLLNLLKLLGGISSSHILSVLLKHLHQMTQFLGCFSPIARKTAKYLISVWGSAEDTTRVIAFLCVLRLVNTDRSMLESVLKQLYLSYVSNSKFTSPSTLPGINFMRRSLVEMYSLDESTSYQHVFLYIRQLAIHLRNAITLQKKEAVQSVLNWQYIHSIHLWSDLLAENNSTLQPLLYPLVQIMIGTVKLIPTTQYYPLRFHITQMMINLSGQTKTFIPILPFLLEVLTSYDLNKKHKKASMKPMDLSCILRVSKAEQTEISFKDTVVEKVYQQMLQYLAQEAYCIGFPDIAIPAVMQLRKFLKTCKVSNYCKVIKSLVDKTEENCRWIEKERKGTTLVLSDRRAVDAWETKVKLKTPPLATFYANFQTVHKRKMAKRATDNEKLGEFKIPTIKKHSKKPVDDSGDPVVLFPSDDESETDSSEGKQASPPPPIKKLKKIKQKTLPIQIQVHQDDGMEEDVVEDLKIEDF